MIFTKKKHLFLQQTFLKPTMNNCPRDEQNLSWHQHPESSSSSNRFIYVKQNFVNNTAIPPMRTVLVNPHFQTKVFINPQFKQPPPKPKIHINPNMFPKNPLTALPDPKPMKVQSSRQTTVICTRTKIVRIPQSSPKKIQKPEFTPRKRRNSLISQFKIVRSTGSAIVNHDSPSKFLVKSKFKLDKRVRKSSSFSVGLVSKSSINNKRKYVYVNRFLSISTMAKSILLKQTNLKKPGFVNINGILYKKSPNSLKKAAVETTVHKSVLNRYKLVKKQSPSKVAAVKSEPETSRRSLVKRFKIIRSRKNSISRVSRSRLRKCNIPCLVFRKFGRCKRNEVGKCFMLHNPDQIVLCTRFLQGACLNKNCLLSHKMSPEKMPTCKYFLEGLCSKDDCPYLHVKISAKAEICRDFLEGFCKKGTECEKRHQFLCPLFEKDKKCPKKRCPYPHGQSRVRNLRNLKIAKKFSRGVKKPKKPSKFPVNVSDMQQQFEARYYKESGDKELDESCSEKVVGGVTKNFRPKLGLLPAFIPLNETEKGDKS